MPNTHWIHNKPYLFNPYEFTPPEGYKVIDTKVYSEWIQKPCNPTVGLTYDTTNITRLQLILVSPYTGFLRHSYTNYGVGIEDVIPFIANEPFSISIDVSESDAFCFTPTVYINDKVVELSNLQVTSWIGLKQTTSYLLEEKSTMQEQNMNNLTPEEQAQLKSLMKKMCKPKPWEPKGGEYSIFENGTIAESISTRNSKSFGAEYQTKEQAEWARDQMRSFNRQLAWLAENDDGWKLDTAHRAQQKYYVYFDTAENQFSPSLDLDYVDLNKIYMSKSNAEKLADLLNKGIVKL